MNPVLVLFAALLLFGAKKKTAGMINVTVDFSNLAPGRYQLIFTDTANNATIFDTNNGYNSQSQMLPNGQYNISFVCLTPDPDGCIARVALDDANNTVLTYGESATVSALNSYYAPVLNCR